MGISKSKCNNEISSRGQFALVPNEIWTADIPGLSHAARSVWCYLLSENPNWDSSCNNVARNLKIESKTASRLLKQLAAANMITITEGQRESWNFTILPPSHWRQNDTGVKRHQCINDLSSEVEMTALLGGILPHIQEDKKKKEEKEEKGSHSGFINTLANKQQTVANPITTTVAISNTTTPARLSPSALMKAAYTTRDWKSRLTEMLQLMEQFQEQGYSRVEVAEHLGDMVDLWCPSTRPQSKSREQYLSWQRSVQQDLTSALNTVFKVASKYDGMTQEEIINDSWAIAILTKQTK